MSFQYLSMALIVALLIDVSFAKQGEFGVAKTKEVHLPHLQTTTSSSSSSNSPYHATFIPTVPNASANKYIYHNSQRDGTVFIAAGSCIGFIMLSSFAFWLAFTIRAWKSARQEYRLRELENKYQYDPFYFGEPEFYDNATDFSGSSDISEEVLKTKMSEQSVYDLESTSAPNILNQLQPPYSTNVIADHNAPFSNTNALFVSPTETLRKQGDNNETVRNLALGAAQLSSDRRDLQSNTFTPRLHVLTETVRPPLTCMLPPTLKDNGRVNACSNLNYSPYTALTDISDNNNANFGGQSDAIEAEDYRPPSTHLDILLDHSLTKEGYES